MAISAGSGKEQCTSRQALLAEMNVPVRSPISSTRPPAVWVTGWLGFEKCPTIIRHQAGGKGNIRYHEPRPVQSLGSSCNRE
ncbi:hypothetical protein Pmani_036125 [Petrolisthes manimaculis]|uniref:Uncharacterized protein n=1 Tax=Petrolisthes manimaculis TaxID=1843537 RepID=A0AAE1TPQ0_9EUCA|nr:hypothetical protein Pmani_036125 [Petrolisthes manimaculis]